MRQLWHELSQPAWTTETYATVPEIRGKSYMSALNVIFYLCLYLRQDICVYTPDSKLEDTYQNGPQVEFDPFLV